MTQRIVTERACCFLLLIGVVVFFSEQPGEACAGVRRVSTSDKVDSPGPYQPVCEGGQPPAVRAHA